MSKYIALLTISLYCIQYYNILYRDACAMTCIVSSNSCQYTALLNGQALLIPIYFHLFTLLNMTLLAINNNQFMTTSC